MELNDLVAKSMKVAMRQKDKQRLGTIRLIRAEVKRMELDQGHTANDQEILIILEKMLKQRRESIKQYDSAGRTDLAQIESAEITVIQEFLPEQLDDDAIQSLVKETVKKCNAITMKDMGPVMATLKPQTQGRADMGRVSSLVKSLLNG